MKLLISEVLQKVSNAKTKAQKVKILQENNTNALRSLLIVNFDESVVSLLPGKGSLWFQRRSCGTEHTSGERVS